ncbi:UNVERIFIED_CONTAM: hypothetical protein GTU68_045784, partial [Idotea baltica]|nr:hypothetical protein [Idotea baltica]
MATQTITDIIILSRSKLAPEGFTLFGEMNGLSICFKPGAATGSAGPPPQKPMGPNPLPYSMNPEGRGSISSNSSGGIYPGLSDNHRSGPTRQAPLPPTTYPGGYRPPATDHTSDNIYDSTQSSLSGVPFILNKKYVESSPSENSKSFPSKSRQQVEDEVSNACFCKSSRRHLSAHNYYCLFNYYLV